MKIAIFLPEKEFSKELQTRLSQLGTICYAKSRKEMTETEIFELAKNAEIIGIDPDNFGGFEKAQDRVTKLAQKLPNLKAVTLGSTSFGWIDREYFRKRKISICNIPGYSRESVAEHTIALLLCAAKQILLTDRRTQKNAYKIEMGIELKGKTLGIIGLGNIGSRTAEIANGIGMKVIAYNRSPKNQKGVEMVSLNKLLKTADCICFHTTHEPKNKHFIGQKEISLMKKGVIIVTTADKEIIDEKALAKALKSGQIATYIYEGENLTNNPLSNIETAIGIRGFGWYTKESMQNLLEIFVKNIECLAKNKPQNVVN